MLLNVLFPFISPVHDFVQDEAAITLPATFLSCIFHYYNYGNFHKLYTCNTTEPYCPCAAHPLYQLG